MLDELDKELEKRGHRFARDADDANIDVRSRQAGERVRARVTRVLERTRWLTVNEAKSAVARPWNRTCLGCTCTRRQPNQRKVREKALQACNAKVRVMTGRTRGRTMRQLVTELRQLLLGWRACFGVAEGRSPLRDLDKWIRRRLRSDPWKPWGRKRYREPRGSPLSRLDSIEKVGGRPTLCFLSPKTIMREPPSPLRSRRVRGNRPGKSSAS